ncbi:alpha-1A adrenergic receptor [Alosa sapidissima]|uniref:alpha-1A adrenergic receptor n=1 Tax=Alosa sapidissima TaxID=34773 RepID=UPI001C07FE16|nr:alpha-1A adrenergic receptor [Alosa sapidissima]
MVPADANSSASPPSELCPNCSLASLAAVPVGKAVALGLVLLVFMVCGVLGNVLVILSVVCHRHLRTVTHYFIVNLAVADLLLSAAVLPFSLALELFGRWVFGRLLCNMWAVLDVLCCTASILSLCAISVDRFLAVSRPLQYPALVTGRRGLVTVAMLWTLAAAISVGPLLGWRQPMPEDESVCRVNEDPGYVLFSALGSFYVPLAVILVMYCRVYVVARRHSRARSRSLRDGGATSLRMHCGNAQSVTNKQDRGGGDGGGGGGGGGGKSGRRSLLRLLRFSREQRAAKTLGMVVGCFILCWLPFFLVLPIGSMFPSYHPSETVFKVTFWLGYFNSCLNPIIYPCTCQEFKRAFLSVLRAQCLRKAGHASRQHKSPRLSYSSATHPPPCSTPPPQTPETLPAGAHRHRHRPHPRADDDAGRPCWRASVPPLCLPSEGVLFRGKREPLRALLPDRFCPSPCPTVPLHQDQDPSALPGQECGSGSLTAYKQEH